LSDTLPSDSTEFCARLSAEVAQIEKGEDVVVLDLRGLAGFTDFFVIATASSERRRTTIVDAVERRVRERVGRKPIHLEGYPAAGWLLADYVDFVVHVFSRESRQLYQLEKLWGDAARWYPEPPGAPGVEHSPDTP
jgi:ribosome-associated protein